MGPSSQGSFPLGGRGLEVRLSKDGLARVLLPWSFSPCFTLSVPHLSPPFRPYLPADTVGGMGYPPERVCVNYALCPRLSVNVPCATFTPWASRHSKPIARFQVTRLIYPERCPDRWRHPRRLVCSSTTISSGLLIGQALGRLETSGSPHWRCTFFMRRRGMERLGNPLQTG